MDRKEVINKLKQYFSIKELVCCDVYNRFKEGAWDFFDIRLLEVLLWLRESINQPITINNWNINGQFSQRGLRSTCCQIVRDKAKSGKPYLSAHITGQAIDLDVKNCSAEEVRNWIDNNKQYLPHHIRLEKGVTWCHLDVRNYTSKPIVYFSV